MKKAKFRKFPNLGNSLILVGNKPEDKDPNDNEPDNSESAGSTITAPIIEIPQNLTFSENNQRL